MRDGTLVLNLIEPPAHPSVRIPTTIGIICPFIRFDLDKKDGFVLLGHDHQKGAKGPGYVAIRRTFIIGGLWSNEEVEVVFNYSIVQEVDVRAEIKIFDWWIFLITMEFKDVK